MVDLELGVPYSLKVCMCVRGCVCVWVCVRGCVCVCVGTLSPIIMQVALNTVSSHSISYYRLPRDAYTSSRLSVHPHTLPVNGTTTITWSLSRASKNDRICNVLCLH